MNSIIRHTRGAMVPLDQIEFPHNAWPTPRELISLTIKGRRGTPLKPHQWGG
jgi:hypothetical protein